MPQREFDTDGEEKQHNPDLRQCSNRFDVRNEIQPIGPDERAGNQESSDRGKSELMEYKDDGDRRREDDEEICERTVVGHNGNHSDVKSERGHARKIPRTSHLPYFAVQAGDYPSNKEGTRQRYLFN